jgi:tetratricopeptide (TPR) repeat protein
VTTPRIPGRARIIITARPTDSTRRRIASRAAFRSIRSSHEQQAMTSTRRIAAIVTAGLIASLASARAAAAPSEKERDARTHFQAGETKFKAGEFDAALAEYQAGYDAKPLPGFLVNIAQCQRRLGDLKAARATYQKFVLVAPDSPLVPQVRSMIAEIDGLLDSTDKSKSGNGAAGEEKPEATPPPAAKAEPEPAAAPVLVAAAPAPAPARSSHRWWLWGAIGAVVVGGAVTAVVLSSGGTTTIHDGSIGTLRR